MGKKWICKACDPMPPCVVEVGALDDRPFYCPYIQGMIADFIESTEDSSEVEDHLSSDASDKEMTQLQQFTAMLDSCGHEYSTYPELVRFNIETPKSLELITVEVHGRFYDELYAFFTKDGEMVQMHSHVTCVRADTKKARELLGIPE